MGAKAVWLEVHLGGPIKSVKLNFIGPIELWTNIGNIYSDKKKKAYALEPNG